MQVLVGYAQNKRKDSLQNVLKQTNLPDSAQVNVLVELSALYALPKPDSCLFLAQKAAEISLKTHFPKGQVEANYQIGMLFFQLGNYDQSLRYLSQTVDLAEKYRLEKNWGDALNQIAILYQNQNEHQVALNYLQKALAIRQKIKDKIGEAHTLSRFGVTYEQLGDYQKALSYSEESLKMNELYGTKSSLSTSYNNIGFIYTRYKNPKKALTYLQKALKLKQEIGDRALTTLNNLGICYQQLGDYQTSLQYSLQSLQTARITKEKLRIKEASETLSQTYRLLGQFEESLKYYEIFTNYKDSLLNDRMKREIMGMELQRNAAEKERLQQKNELQESELKNAQATVQLQYLSLAFFAVFLFLMLVLAYVLYRNKQKEHTTNELLKIKNEEINLQNEELRQTQEAVIYQKDMLAKKNEQLEDYKTKITQSINSAKVIQNAILPTQAKMDKLFSEHFILFLPKDVVSGDFYWATQIGTQRFLVLADCTGHGVSGAFMTMIGNTLLDRLIRVFDIHDPARVLTLLHIEIQNVLQQEQTGNVDGMDVAIVALEEKENEQEITFAGAKRPLYYVLTDTTEAQKVNGTRRAIGGVGKDEKAFKNEVFILPKGSMIYLSSDGYIDQSNPERRSFTEKRFMGLLSLLQKTAIPKQQQFLEKALKKHQKTSDQRDDILVLGVRV